MATPRVVIIGGGFGGLFGARAFRHAAVQVTLVDRHNHHVFQPLLYQVATAGLSPGDIASPIRWILRRQKNVRVLLGEAQAIDVQDRRVLLDGGEALEYDYLIVAAGADNSYFGHPEWAQFAPALKTLDDALQLRGRMLLAYEVAEREADPVVRRRMLTSVIVGGGPTGVEMAGAIAEIAHQTLSDEFQSIRTAESRIVLAEAGPTILATFPERLRNAARKSLLKLGVEVRENTAVTRVEHEAVWLGDERTEAGTIIWAAGITASPLGKTLGAPTDRAGRVLVQKDLTIPGHPEVFVVGDLASLADEDGHPYARRRAGRDAAGATGGTQRHPRCRAPAARGVPLQEPRQHGHHRPQRGDRGSRLASGLRLSGVAALAVHPHRVADRVPKPDSRAGAVGGRVPDVSAECAADYGQVVEEDVGLTLQSPWN